MPFTALSFVFDDVTEPDARVITPGLETAIRRPISTGSTPPDTYTPPSAIFGKSSNAMIIQRAMKLPLFIINYILGRAGGRDRHINACPIELRR